MVIIFERDEAERLQHPIGVARNRIENFCHAVHGARFGLKSDLDEIALRELMRQAQQSAGGRNGLELGSGAPAIFCLNRSQDGVA